MNDLIIIALKHYGQNHKDYGFPWCAAFLNDMLSEVNTKGTGSNMARSFLDIGKHTERPKLGDIVVLWRVGKDTQWGHCGLYIDIDDYWVTILGGNQDGVVKIKRYPIWMLLDIRTL